MLLLQWIHAQILEFVLKLMSICSNIWVLRIWAWTQLRLKKWAYAQENWIWVHAQHFEFKLKYLSLCSKSWVSASWAQTQFKLKFRAHAQKIWVESDAQVLSPYSTQFLLDSHIWAQTQLLLRDLSWAQHTRYGPQWIINVQIKSFK